MIFNVAHKVLFSIFLWAMAASAVPTPQGGDPFCGEIIADYSVTEITAPFIADPVQPTGWRCSSQTNEVCQLDKEVSYSTSIAYTVEAGFTASVDIGKIFGVAANAGFSTTWATETGSASTATLICPAGLITCGIRAIASLVRVSGQKTSSCRDTGVVQSVENYQFTTALTAGNGAPNQQAVITFETCLIACEGDACQIASNDNLPPCP